MATKSILKNVTVKDSQTANKLATALEQSGYTQAQKRQAAVHYSVASPDDIRKMFGRAKNEIHSN